MAILRKSCPSAWMLKCLCSEHYPPGDDRKGKINTYPACGLDCKEIQPVHSEGDHPWDFFGRNDAEAETPILWPPDEKSWLIWRDPDAGKDWGQEEKGMTENETAGWYRRLDECEFEWTLGVGDGQGGLVCYSPWGRQELDTTEQLNWTALILSRIFRLTSIMFLIIVLNSCKECVSGLFGKYRLLKIRAFHQSQMCSVGI